MGTSSSKLQNARTKLNQGAIYYAREEYANAIEYYEEALKLLKIFYKEQPFHPLIVSTLYKLSLAQAGLGMWSESGATLKESLEIREKICKDANNLDSVLTKLQEHYKQQLHPTASVLTILATGSDFSSHLAIEYFKSALSDYRRINWDKQESLDVVVFLCHITIVYLRLIYYREAAATFKECLDVSRRVPLDTKSISISLSIMAKLYSKNGDWHEAIRHHKECLDLRREIHTKSPGHEDIVASLDELAEAHEQLGDLDEAIKYTKEAFNLRKNVDDPFNLDFAECLIKLADLHRKSNQPDKETRLSRELLDMCEVVLMKKYDRSKLDKIVSHFARSYITCTDSVKPYGEIAKLLDRFKIDTSISSDYSSVPTYEPPRPPNRPAGPNNIPKND